MLCVYMVRLKEVTVSPESIAEVYQRSLAMGVAAKNMTDKENIHALTENL